MNKLAFIIICIGIIAFVTIIDYKRDGGKIEIGSDTTTITTVHRDTVIDTLSITYPKQK